MDYFQQIQEFYSKTLAKSSLTNSQEAKKFEQALILLEEPDLVNQTIEENDDLKTMFGFQNHVINIINESSESDSSSSEKESLPSYSSEELTGTLRMDNTFPKMEPGYPTGRTKEDHSQKKRKTPFFETSTSHPQEKDIPFGRFTLNLDSCPKDRKTLIELWAKEMSLIIQTNSEKYYDQNTVLLLLDHKTHGSVNKFIKDTEWAQTNFGPTETFEYVLDGIYTMFLGIDFSLSKEKEKFTIIERAKDRLTKMQICDICQLEQFYCEYEKNLYDTGDQEGYKTYVIDYIRKIPLVGEIALMRFNHEKSATSQFSLAFAHKIVKEEISKICDLTRKQKQLKSFSKKCCDKIVEKDFTYGCQPSHTQGKRKKSFKRKSKYSFKKKRKTFKPGKYVQKKQTYKKKFCPKGKKNCRCWVCNEEGHYANECPNRKQHQDKVKMLEEVIFLGLHPIEDEYEGYEEVFIIEFDPGESSSESSNGSSDSE